MTTPDQLFSKVSQVQDNKIRFNIRPVMGEKLKLTSAMIQPKVTFVDVSNSGQILLISASGKFYWLQQLRQIWFKSQALVFLG